jgi:hypothetical protein
LKIRVFFLLFNAILAVLLLLICSCLILGSIHAYQNIAVYAAIFLAAVLVGTNAFYAHSRRLFLLLERRDWPALSMYLEARVLHRGRYSAPLVRLLAYSYLVLSDPRAVMALEFRVGIAKPELREANLLIFGAARILARDYEGAAQILKERLDEVSSRKTSRLRRESFLSRLFLDEDEAWIRWYYGFSLLLGQHFMEAAEVFIPIALNSPDAVLTALSAYFLSESLGRLLPASALDYTLAAERGRTRILASLPTVTAWEQETERLHDNIHTAILNHYLHEAARWLYPHRGFQWVQIN